MNDNEYIINLAIRNMKDKLIEATDISSMPKHIQGMKKYRIQVAKYRQVRTTIGNAIKKLNELQEEIKSK